MRGALAFAGGLAHAAFRGLVNLIGNGSFETGIAGWTARNATLSNPSQTLRVAMLATGSFAGGYTAIATTPGQQYVVVIDVLGGTANGLIAAGSTPAGADLGSLSGNGLARTFTFTAVGSETYIMGYILGSNANGTYCDFDNVSVKRA